MELVMKLIASSLVGRIKSAVWGSYLGLWLVWFRPSLPVIYCFFFGSITLCWRHQLRYNGWKDTSFLMVWIRWPEGLVMLYALECFWQFSKVGGGCQVDKFSGLFPSISCFGHVFGWGNSNQSTRSMIFCNFNKPCFASKFAKKLQHLQRTTSSFGKISNLWKLLARWMSFSKVTEPVVLQNLPDAFGGLRGRKGLRLRGWESHDTICSLMKQGIDTYLVCNAYLNIIFK